MCTEKSHFDRMGHIFVKLVTMHYKNSGLKTINTTGVKVNQSQDHTVGVKNVSF